MYYCKSYVDNCMKGLTEDKIQYKINTFNNCHNTLKFTTEEDKNNSINFPDSAVNYNKLGELNQIGTKRTYVLATYLHYQSYSPLKYNKV